MLRARRCSQAAAEKASTHFSPRDVASCVYSLGQLGRRDEVLLPRLLSRVATEAADFHAIEMMLTAHGLADLHVAPPTALTALSNAALPKIDQFGAEELPRLCARAPWPPAPAHPSTAHPPPTHRRAHVMRADARRPPRSARWPMEARVAFAPCVHERVCRLPARAPRAACDPRVRAALVSRATASPR